MPFILGDDRLVEFLVRYDVVRVIEYPVDAAALYLFFFVSIL